MSLLAEVMEAIRYTEEQNQLILARNIPLTVLAKRFGKSVRRLGTSTQITDRAGEHRK